MTKKNCLLVFKNKKLNIFEDATDLVSRFSSAGYYFDKISYVAYDSSEEIVRAVKDGKEHYENIVIYCPYEMQSLLKNYINTLYSSRFNESGILSSGNANVFILYNDRENVLPFDEIKRMLDGKYGLSYDKAYIKTVGAPQTKVKYAIEKAKQLCPEADFNVSDVHGNCKIEILYSDQISKTGHDALMRELVTELNPYVYAMEDVELAEMLYRLLKLRRMKISVAESFTGGGLSKKLVEISGISEVFFEGLNTYSNEAKERRLGVNEVTLRHSGAVSEQTAREMAQGLIKSGNCDISIATTGIAGPKSDNTFKPVGLIYIAVGTREKTDVYQYNLSGDRKTITETAVNLALFLAYKTLK